MLCLNLRPTGAAAAASRQLKMLNTLQTFGQDIIIVSHGQFAAECTIIQCDRECNQINYSPGQAPSTTTTTNVCVRRKQILSALAL